MKSLPADHTAYRRGGPGRRGRARRSRFHGRDQGARGEGAGRARRRGQPAGTHPGQRVGLDTTEHGDRTGVEVVLHGKADAQKLRAAGFTWRVEDADLGADDAPAASADRAYAASVAESRAAERPHVVPHLPE